MHTGVGRGGRRGAPSKDFEKLSHTNAIKHEKRGPPSQIFSQPYVPPQKNLKMTVHL